MRILVTGHRGLLGSACVRVLRKNHEILIYVDNLFDEQRFRRWLLSNKPDGIVHCAAKVGGVGSNQADPVGFLTANLRIQQTVIESAADFGVKKLVFIGTSCLFPRMAPLPVSEDSLLTGPFEPAVEAYAIAKLAGYAMCKAYNEQCGKKFLTVCPSNIYGPGDNYGPSAHVIPALISRLAESIKSGSPLVVWGDGSAVREFIYVDDVATGIGAVIEKWDGPGLINIGSGIGTTIRELVSELAAASGFTGEVIYDATKPVGIPKKTFDVSKIKSIGWSPSTDLRTGIKSTWTEFMQNKSHRIK